MIQHSVDGILCEDKNKNFSSKGYYQDHENIESEIDGKDMYEINWFLITVTKSDVSLCLKDNL